MPAEQPKLGSVPPSRSARSRCWQARDAYFACLDAHNLYLHGLAPQTHEEIIALDPQRLTIASEKDRKLSKEAKQKLFACKAAKAEFDKECLASWVQHFSLLRVKDLQTQYLKKKVEDEEKRQSTSNDEFWEKVSAKPKAK
ncbi:uncharacterized protein EV422DRAFT_219704 [Fimicolochytrium jonesii]|uniref:uncharacterized protein n=1 Tax=Fimicolochytrium jonesii TaxID=1396493 RepID=UPI0022FE7AF3|nr:uncharacterized protein EV422DRAFT_219704 [Fimicolochytrium jonesii]KAI8817587.1 hypothetical protein EV422DRAFT_219704 [Fimicolochytrium jonesii]